MMNIVMEPGSVLYDQIMVILLGVETEVLSPVIDEQECQAWMGAYGS